MVSRRFFHIGRQSITGRVTLFARATPSCSTMKARGAAKHLLLAKSRVLLQQSNTGCKRNCSSAIWTRSEIGALRLSTLKASGEFCRLAKATISCLLPANPTRCASLSKQLSPTPTWTGSNTSNTIRVMSVQQKSIYWLVTRRRRERLSVGNRRCVSTSWCVSWWMLTWHCCRERRPESISASCRNPLCCCEQDSVDVSLCETQH